MEQVAAAAVAIWIYMTGMFLVALKAEDNSIADMAWGPGFILVGALCTLISGQLTARQVMMLALIVIWGSRLAWHIHMRSEMRSGEDFRYAAWRESWGKWFVLRSYLQIFMLQGLAMLVISTPLIVVNVDPGGPLGLFALCGLALWIVGFTFEAVGDWQLLQFKKDRTGKGRLMTEGLWRYTRHPNYFGEVSLWWGVFLVALGTPGGWWAVVSPLTVTFLLLKVSGIPMLEKKYEGNPEFEAYKHRTSAFFPWFPKEQATADRPSGDDMAP